jgi:hypothetical protein
VRPNQEDNNVSEHIYSKLGSSLHNAHDHPLGVLKARILLPLRSLPKPTQSPIGIIVLSFHFDPSALALCSSECHI